MTQTTARVSLKGHPTYQGAVLKTQAHPVSDWLLIDWDHEDKDVAWDGWVQQKDLNAVQAT
jgi:hypothetical protein